MQRLKLEHGRELRSPTQLVSDDIGGDLGGKRQRESHKSEDSTKEGRTVNIARPAVPCGSSTRDMRLYSMSAHETVAILGARRILKKYTYKAFRMLRDNGHR